MKSHAFILAVALALASGIADARGGGSSGGGHGGGGGGSYSQNAITVIGRRTGQGYVKVTKV